MSGEWIRTTARTVLTRAVRGRAEQGSTWGEAVLAEFDQTTGTWGALRWMAGGLRVVWRERSATRATASPRVRVARRLAMGVVATTAIVFLANQYVLTVHYQPSGSMQPTVDIGDRVLVDLIGFRVSEPDRGDLVLVTIGKDDEGDSVQTVRRLIGLPGDRIECHDGHVFRNGAALDEPYLEAETKTSCDPTTVADGAVYALGDWRTGSFDSRARPYRQEQLVGRVFTF